MDEITSFNGPYRFLSNFWPVQIMFENVMYPSVEHAYQAAKTLDPEIREEVRSQSTAGKAKRFGFAIPKRADWTDVNADIMYGLLCQKFEKDPLRQQLLDTEDAKLIEGNDWGDKHWGKVLEDGKWVGANILGDMLMDIREKLRG